MWGPLDPPLVSAKDAHLIKFRQLDGRVSLCRQLHLSVGRFDAPKNAHKERDEGRPIACCVC